MKKTQNQRLHKAACRKYLEEFLLNNGYIYCELCSRSNKPPYSTHHIYHAGTHPKHPELHNHLNLILLCWDCHSGIHLRPKEFRETIEQLEEERGLVKLFKGGANYISRNNF